MNMSSITIYHNPACGTSRWFQICTALAVRNASGDFAPVNFGPFERAYQAFTEKLQPQVFSLGFLR
jgi:hypothetical protein